MIKKLALATAISLLAALPLPMWNATRDLVTRRSLPAAVWIAVGVAYVFSAILPLFYLAMWRNGEDAGVSKRLRWLCPVGALCGGAVIVTHMPVTTVETLLSVVATLSCVALLIAMFFRPIGAFQASRFLHSMTWIAVVGGTLWFAINLLTLVSNPSPGARRTLFEQLCLFSMPFLIAVSRRFR